MSPYPVLPSPCLSPSMTSPIHDILSMTGQSNSKLSSSGNDVFNFNKVISTMDNRSPKEAETNLKLSSCTDYHFDSATQTQKQSLTPIPEMRLNDSPVNQNRASIETSPHVKLNTFSNVDVTSQHTCTFEIPKHIDPASLQCRILTKYFVAVSGDSKHEITLSSGKTFCNSEFKQFPIFLNLVKLERLLTSSS